MTGPADPFERALAAALRPPEQLRLRPDAGYRLRRRTARRRAVRAGGGITGTLVLIAVAVLAVGSVVQGGVLPPPSTTGAALAMQTGPTPAGELPVLPWNDSPADPLEFSYGQSELTNPLEVVRVGPVAARECPAAAAKARDSGLTAPRYPCYDLVRPAILVVTHLAGADVISTGPSGAAGVALSLGASDSTALRHYTSKHVGTPIAFVVSNRVWWTAEIGRPVVSGVIEIAVESGTADAVELVDSLGLRVERSRMPIPMRE
jgi:hypothetical protein